MEVWLQVSQMQFPDMGCQVEGWGQWFEVQNFMVPSAEGKLGHFRGRVGVIFSKQRVEVHV